MVSTGPKPVTANLRIQQMKKEKPKNEICTTKLLKEIQRKKKEHGISPMFYPFVLLNLFSLDVLLRIQCRLI